MIKVSKNPSTALFPVPAVMVTAQSGDGKPNIVTIAWTGIMASNPPMVYVGVQPSRHSHKMIKESGEYVINIPSGDLAKATDYCGMVSGRDVDKFKEAGLTAVPGSKVKVPLIKECPVNLECKVRETLSLGSHDVFVAEVVAVHYNEEVLNDKGMPELAKINPFAFCMGQYRALGDAVGSFGFSRKS